MACTLLREQALWEAGAVLVAGVDEAGRGCLAGPVVAAAVVVPPGFAHPTLNDSKKLSPLQRSTIFADLTTDPRLVIGIGQAGADEIDRINILRATHLAMERAIHALPRVPTGLLIDGLPVRPFPFVHQAVVGGDALCLSIAAASVVAKVTRDRFMTQADTEFPGYGFARHKGYGTATHLAALAALGPSPLHRQSFAPVRQQTLGLEPEKRRTLPRGPSGQSGRP